MLDPDPPVTIRRDVRIIAVRVTPAELFDPHAHRTETAASPPVARLGALYAAEVPDGAAVGVVGIGATAAVATQFSAELGARVDRLALVAAAAPDGRLPRDEGAKILAGVTAKTLILNGPGEGRATAASAVWHRDHLADARVEMVPGTRVGIEGPSLVEVWPRVLSHVAPGSLRHR